MKSLFCLVIFVILSTYSCFGQQYGWVQISSPVSESLRNIYVLGSEVWLNSGSSIYYSSNYPSDQFSLVYDANGQALYDLIIKNYHDNNYAGQLELTVLFFIIHY